MRSIDKYIEIDFQSTTTIINNIFIFVIESKTIQYFNCNYQLHQSLRR